MQRALDKEPADWLLRKALADAYEEAGGADAFLKATYLRFTAERRLRPQDRGAWFWFRNSDDPSANLNSFYEKYAVVTTGKCEELEAPWYKSRTEAEEALRRALEKHDYKMEELSS